MIFSEEADAMNWDELKGQFSRAAGIVKESCPIELTQLPAPVNLTVAHLCHQRMWDVRLSPGEHLLDHVLRKKEKSLDNAMRIWV